MITLARESEIDLGNAINLCCLHKFAWMIPFWLIDKVRHGEDQGETSALAIATSIEYVRLRYPQYIFKAAVNDPYSRGFFITKSIVKDDDDLAKAMYI